MSDNYIIPANERERFEISEAHAAQAVSLMESVLEQVPDDPDYMYQYIWAEELVSELSHAFPAWAFDYDTVVADLSAIGAEGGKTAVLDHVRTAEAYAPFRQRSAEGHASIDRAYAMLAKMEPVEAGQFSFLEATYTLISQRAYVTSGLDFDFDQGIAVFGDADTLLRGFITANPDFRNAYHELGITLNEMALMHSYAQQAYAEDRSSEICKLLTDADAFWSTSIERWGAPLDYAADYEVTQRMLRDAECN